MGPWMTGEPGNRKFAAGAALLACWRQQPGVAWVAAAAAAATFAVHAVREAIYLSPGQGSEEPAVQ